MCVTSQAGGLDGANLVGKWSLELRICHGPAYGHTTSDVAMG